MDLSNFKLPTLSKICIDCGKRCNSQRGCLITQIFNEINKERGRLPPVKYVAVLMKLKKKSDLEISIALSNGKDYKNRNGSFGKFFWGSLKIK